RTALAEQPRLLATVGQSLGRRKHGQRARLAEAEVEILLGELAIELEAFHAEPPKKGHRPPHAARRAGGAEAPEPSRQLKARPRLDVERALRVEHPLDALPPDPRGRERHEVGGDDEPGVAVGATRADFALLEERD